MAHSGTGTGWASDGATHSIVPSSLGAQAGDLLVFGLVRDGTGGHGSSGFTPTNLSLAASRTLSSTVACHVWSSVVAAANLDVAHSVTVQYEGDRTYFWALFRGVDPNAPVSFTSTESYSGNATKGTVDVDHNASLLFTWWATSSNFSGVMSGIFSGVEEIWSCFSDGTVRWEANGAAFMCPLDLGDAQGPIFTSSWNSPNAFIHLVLKPAP